MMFDREFIYDILYNHDAQEAADAAFDNKNFLYDYNEVQELYFDNTNNYFVYLAGVSGLNKEKLLCKIVRDLIKSGAAKRDIIYADFELPFIRELSILEIADFFPPKSDKPLYLVINEIGLRDGFFIEIERLREVYPNIKLLASCSIPFLVYEYLQDNPDEYSKSVVLSPKNESNIKGESDTFGVQGYLKYNIKNGVCEIKGTTKEGKLLNKHVVPPTINGYPVKIIASGAFHHRSELTEIELPDTIEYIGDYAFTRCDNLSNIKIPKNLAYMGDCAFLGATKLLTIAGGDNITHIGCSALYATAWLNNQTGDSVTLGKVLYRYKGKQKPAALPAAVSVLGSYSFRSTEIAEIDLSRIKNIEEGCFFGCKKLSEVKGYPDEDIGAFVFYDCRSLINVDTTIAEAGKYAFYNCTGLKDVALNNAELGAGAFENCINLTAVSGNIATAGKCAFYKASIAKADLTTAKIVGEFAFYASRISEILLSAAHGIGRYAFAHIGELREVYLQGRAAIGTDIFCCSDNIVRAELSGTYPLSYYFGGKSNVEQLSVNGDCCDNFCRNNDALKEVSIFNGKIGNWAFYNNANLTSVKLQKCNGIGAWAFSHCENLQAILIPESVSNIEMNAFRYCRKLARIELQSAVPVTFGANAFYSTDELKKIFVVDKNPYLGIPIWREYKNNLQVSDFLTRRKSAIAEAQKNIEKTFKVIVDRSMGTEHPKHKGTIYPINYGYIEDLVAGDGEEQDVYIIDGTEPLNETMVKIIAVVFRKNDNETKWVGVIGNNNYTKDEIKNRIAFQERYYDIEIISV
ncbi:MAG: leucine-rich repeat protein [Clostridiales bacterium]|jgi:inorganic pyrophosphatase|nr:leucine-rich repeat protein [Clostridiales bacterium]